MITFLIRRTGHMAVVMCLLMLVTFALLHLAPGGPAQALLGPDQVSPEMEAMVESRLGLDRPMGIQLMKWAQAVITGDLGDSYFYRQPALAVVLERLPGTIVLGGVAAVIALAVGVPTGIQAARHPGGLLDRFTRSAAVAIIALPAFWLGILLIFLFSVELGWVPSAGTGRSDAATAWLPNPTHLVLPAVTVALPSAANFMLFTRAAMIGALATDAVRTARGMGSPERRVLSLHAWRQAMGPLLMQLGLYLPHLIEGSIVVESVFSWPGIGMLTTASIGRRDYPILLTLTLLLGLGTLLASALTDLLHARLDPRIELR